MINEDKYREVDTHNVEYDIRELRSKWSCDRNNQEELFLYLVDKIEALEALLEDRE